MLTKIKITSILMWVVIKLYNKYNNCLGTSDKY